MKLQSSRLKGRLAIVTGAAQGNGKGIARALARAGATLALFDILDIVKETVNHIRNLGQEAVSFQVDVTDASQVTQATGQVLRQFGKIDILVNNVGGGPSALFVDISDDVRDFIINLNFKGTWNCTKAVIPSMIEQRYGKIVNISSVTGPMVAIKGTTAYCAAKGGVSGFTRALALEVAEYGINVNAICPGYVDTPLMRGYAREMGLDPDRHVKDLGKSVPLGRVGSVDELGDLAVFLASDESKYITGTEIVFDGGNIIQEEK
jgi:hypothetical protein